MPKYNPTWVQREVQARESFSRYYMKKLVIKSLLYNSQEFNINAFNKMYWSLSFHNCPKKSSQAIFRRVCVLTHSPRSIFRLFKMSRHSLKKQASWGLAAGMRKASF